MKQILNRTLSLLTALALTLSLSSGVLAAPDGLLIMPAPIAPAPIAPAPEPVGIRDYLDAVSALQQLGYSQTQMQILLANLSSRRILSLSQQEYHPRLADYAVLDYFHEDRLDRYTAYGALHPELSAEDVVTYVNIGLDRERYVDTEPVSDPYALDVLVNQYHGLDAEYVPELVTMDQAYTKAWNDRLHPIAYEWFVKMADAARLEGLTLRSVSAYRSYETQSALYARYAARDGVAVAELYSAHPGYSEHQTGLAVDINVAGSRYHFENGSEYQWLMEHCWEYGFILRYPADKTAITGFIFEPWHYRYVGTELALQIRDSGLTYDEFVARQPVDKPSTQLPALTLDGETLSLPSLFVLDGLVYLCAQELVQVLGGSCTLQDEVLTVTTPRLRRSIALDSTALLNPAAICQGQMYLELGDLARLLYLSRWDRDNTVLLSTRSAAEGWPFTDVLPYHETYEAVRYVWKTNLFSGTAADTFSPDVSMTRGMAVTVLQKLDRGRTPSQPPAFPDVASDAWYAAGVAWAAGVDMVSGYPDGLFRPDSSLTREEAAMILHKFARHMGAPVYSATLPSSVTDADQASGWAISALGWACREGLLLPRTDGALAPRDSITRAEMAHALAQLCQNLL